MHHAFTAPVPGHEVWDEASPGDVRGQHYDLVWNGWELGSGSIRIHDVDVQERVFRTMGMTDEEARSKFGFLLDALAMGAPPHGGFAMGIERFVALLAGEPDIRQIVAFPKVSSGSDPLTGAPTPMPDDVLAESGIRALPQEPRPRPELGSMPERRGSRFVVEALFLAALTVALALAHLDAIEIVGAMALGWIVVAAIEWTAWRGEPHFGSGLPPRYYLPRVDLPPPQPLEQVVQGYPELGTRRRADVDRLGFPACRGARRMAARRSRPRRRHGGRAGADLRHTGRRGCGSVDGCRDAQPRPSVRKRRHAARRRGARAPPATPRPTRERPTGQAVWTPRGGRRCARGTGAPARRTPAARGRPAHEDRASPRARSRCWRLPSSAARLRWRSRRRRDTTRRLVRSRSGDYLALAGSSGPAAFGRKTACGGVITSETEGVAHPTLPCGVRIFITFHGHTVLVPVVDRGPYTQGREFDLTDALARRVGLRGVQEIHWSYAEAG